MIKNMVEDYRDEFGALVHADKDGGDSANRMGAYHVYRKILGLEDLEMYTKDMNLVKDSPGRYKRHPNPDRWYSNPKNFSRDQSINLQSAMVMYKDVDRMRELMRQRAKRAFFHFNEMEGDDRPETVKTKIPDPPAPVELGQYIRATDSWWLFPFLYIADLQLLVDVALVRPLTRKQGNKDFDVQFLPLIAGASTVRPTFLSRLALRLYAKQKVDVEAALERYFREGEGLNGLKPLGDMAIDAYNKLIQE